jgi:hypothetical protein
MSRVNATTQRNKRTMNVSDYLLFAVLGGMGFGFLGLLLSPGWWATSGSAQSESGRAK